MSKKIRIAINGFGRIGRSLFKIVEERFDSKVEIVIINDLADNKTLAQLLQYDTLYGKYKHKITTTKDGIKANKKTYKIISEKDPAKLPWKENNIDVVVECTGRFRITEDVNLHIKAGAKKVLLSAPAKDDKIKTVVCGVNDQKNDEKKNILSNASCTTNCIAPVVDVINSKLGIAKAMMTTIHSYTSDQKLVDSPHRDLRRARCAAQNIIPTTTGAAIATTKVVPSMKNLFDGLSVRVPTAVVSLADITMVLKKKTTIEEINKILNDAKKEKKFKGILDTTTEPLVSSDFIGNSYSSTVDLSLTQVVDGDLVKIITWYDNEFGYSNRLAELILK